VPLSVKFDIDIHPQVGTVFRRPGTIVNRNTSMSSSVVKWSVGSVSCVIWRSENVLEWCL